MKTISREEFEKTYGALPTKPQKQSFFSDLVGDIKGVGTDIVS